MLLILKVSGGVAQFFFQFILIFCKLSQMGRRHVGRISESPEVSKFDRFPITYIVFLPQMYGEGKHLKEIRNIQAIT